MPLSSAKKHLRRGRQKHPRRTLGVIAGAVMVTVLGIGVSVVLAASGASTQPVADPPVTAAPAAIAPTTTAAPVTTSTLPPPTTVPPVVAATPTSACPPYSSATYGIDPNDVTGGGGGGGTQLVTVVDPTSTSLAGTFVAWAMGTDGCWSPVSFQGQAPQPYQAQTGYGGLLPISQRVPGDGATPTGLFAFGTTVYGNSTVSPTTLYPYDHLVCGDWWDEQPGSPTYDTFQQVACGTTPPYASDSEALWTETEPYQHFIDIMMPNPPDNGAGIFLHDDTTVGYTAGCVALPNAELDAVLGWLNPADNPHVLIAVG